MSVFFENDEQLKTSLDSLPTSYSNSEIETMVNDLQKDIDQHSQKQFDNLAAKVMFFSDKHKKFCLSFPMLFRSTIKGSFTPSMLKTFLATRERLQKGDLDKEQAQNFLVDQGVKHIQTKNQSH